MDQQHLRVRCILCQEVFDFVSLHYHMLLHHPILVVQAACRGCLLQTIADLANQNQENGHENEAEENGIEENED